MIIQLAPDKQSAFVIRQQDHAEVSGQFAEHFGNNDFHSLSPHDALVYVARHHDDGWSEIDGNPQLDPNTGYVYHLTQTAMPLLIATGNKSPDANEAYHPYSGILSSMHTYGLYHGRYGLSDKIIIDVLGEQWRDKISAMLDIELARQERLKSTIEPSNLVEEDVLFHNYKLLQFFDTLALYIQTVHSSDVGEAQFVNVPRAIGDDVTVTATHDGNHVITVSPWVFDVDSFDVSTEGRIMHPMSADDTEKLAQIFENSPKSQQTYTFKRG